MHVVTIGTDINKMTKLYESAAKHNIAINNWGFGLEWKGTDMTGPGGGMKVNILKKHLYTLKGTDTILFTDAYDVFYADDLKTIRERYESFGKKIVFSAEATCWPDPNIAEQFPAVQTPYRFLNSGTFIAEVGELKRILDACEVRDDGDDQLFYQKAYLEGLYDIVLDTEGYIFQTHDPSTQIINGQLNNGICCPCVYHGNGGDNAKETFVKLYNAMYNAETQLVPVTAQQKEAIIDGKKEWISKSTKNMVENALWHIHEVPCFLNNKDCEYIIECAECHGGWTHKRHHNYPTTDIPIEHLKEVTSMWHVLQPRIIDTCKDVYMLEQSATISMFDVFVVKYDVSGQSGLELHRDVSELSFILLLSHPSSFVGGGTRYEHCDAVHCVDQGSLLVHCGKMRHSGVAITQGTRYVLVGFMNVQSCMIGRLQEGEPPIPENASDKRHLDFLWRGCPPLDVPRRIAVRIINLRFRPEKREQILKVVHRLCIPVGVELDVQVVVADGGGGATAYVSWKSTEAAEKIGGCRKRFWCRDVRKGEIGNFVSHLTTVQAVSNCDYMLVLEDDANFHSDLLYRIDQCLKELSVSEPTWDVIDLGGIPIDNGPPISISESLCQRQCTYQTHCMLYSKSGLHKLAHVDRTVNAIPWDEFIPAARGIHPREALNALWPIGLNVVHTSDRLSWQTAGSIHDTEEDTFFKYAERSVILPKIVEVMEESDMRNWYIFHRQSTARCNVDDIRDLCVKANENMWNFHISYVSGCFDMQSLDWNLTLDRSKKLTVVVCQAENAQLHIQTGQTRTVQIKPGTVCIFPSYLMFACARVCLFYAFGNTFV